MATYRAHSVEFKRQIAQEFLAGQTLPGLAKRHDISSNLIQMRIRVAARASSSNALAGQLKEAQMAALAQYTRLDHSPWPYQFNKNGRHT